MTAFEMIKYHSLEYPKDIPLRIEEIAAHFDVTNVRSKFKRSFHTEYSYGKRKLNSDLLTKYPEILSAQKDGIPQLWKNESWALQFADFVIDLAGDGSKPVLIEVHPPFNDYMDIKGFVRTYSCFEKKMLEQFPDIEILIENRYGSLYRGGKFIVSNNTDVSRLCETIYEAKLKLKVAYDIPQIYTAHNARSEIMLINLLKEAKEFRTFIGGVHLWGKRNSSTGRRVSHCGDLNTYFGDENVKTFFLQAFKDCFDDGIIRKMVLEVNSGSADLNSIIADLKNVGISFI